MVRINKEDNVNPRKLLQSLINEPSSLGNICVTGNVFEEADLSGLVNRRKYLDIEDVSFLRASFHKARIQNLTFWNVNFSHVDFSDAVFKNCNFYRCNFYGANMKTASFQGSTFRGPGYYDEHDPDWKSNFAQATLPDSLFPSPDEDLLVYKKVKVPLRNRGIGLWKVGMATLRLKAGVPRLRVLYGGAKFRCAEAEVVSLTSFTGKTVYELAYSSYDSSFWYEPGKIIKPKEPFDPNPTRQCASGIHFFLTPKDARYYNL